MSRIGKMPIDILAGVNVNITGQQVNVECSGKKNSFMVPDGINIKKNENQIIVERESDAIKLRGLHGLTRVLINNMVIGVKDGFSKKLEMVGRGKKAKVQEKILVLDIGLSHSINFNLPDGIEAKVERTIIEISGIDKQKVGEVAAEIRDLQPPEPYKGSGIRYHGERVRKKAGKSAVGGGFSGAGK